MVTYDEAQVEYYVKIVKRWPKITLKKHNIINTNKKGYFGLNLIVNALTSEQKTELVNLCNSKITEHIQNYKGLIGDYRYNPEDLSSSSVRYLVLKLAHGKCALCGATIKETPIDIDHIIPRNKGGTNKISNLQALCFRCNRAKRDRDNIDFRHYGEVYKEEDCVFCDLNGRVEDTYNSAQWIFDNYPVTPLHSLVIPRQHAKTIDELSSSEISDIFQLSRYIKGKLIETDPKIQGFNVGINEGEIAGQSIMHLHLHIIPRREGDVQNPRGGIRNVIPGKANY